MCQVNIVDTIVVHLCSCSLTVSGLRQLQLESEDLVKCVVGIVSGGISGGL